jgi:hypothetical protein
MMTKSEKCRINYDCDAFRRDNSVKKLNIRSQ